MRNLTSAIAATALLAVLGLSGQARAQEREWLLDAADQDAFLVFGVPETDDVGISFWCKIGSGKIKIFVPDGSPDLKPDTQADFTLTIDGKAHVLKGTTSANTVNGATSVETEFSLTDPMIAELSKADRFQVKVVAHELTFPLIDAGLDNLLKLCHPK